MNVGVVADQLAARLGTIAGLRVFAYPPDSLQPPAAVVGYPETISYDETYGRGSDRLTLPVVVVDGKVSDRATRTRLAAYADGTGAKSVKAVVESGTYTAFDTVRVAAAEFDVVAIAGTDYMACLFDLEIVGSGA